MSLLESEAHQDERALASLLRRLEAERERWFFWVPVLLGVGIGLYFWLSHEPSLMAALAPFAIAIALKAVAPRSVLMTLVTGALLTVTFGFGLAKLRVEWVRAPVLSRQITTDLRGFVERVEPRDCGRRCVHIEVVFGVIFNSRSVLSQTDEQST